MRSARIAVSLDPKAIRLVDRLVKSGRYVSRSKLLQEALAEKLHCIGRSRLAAECAKLTKREERGLANDSLLADVPWPGY